MKKVLILANYDLGLYKFRRELIQELLNRGNKVYISLPQGEMVQNLIEMGCEFIETPMDRRGINPVRDYKLFLFYSKILKELKPDLVISYTIKPNIYGGIACRIKNIPYITNVTGLGSGFYKSKIVKQTVTLLYRLSCARAKLIFFENEENKNFFVNNKIASLEKTYKLNGAGVNLEEYNYCDYPKEEDGINFLFIGRVMEEKGVNELIEAAYKVKKNHDNVHFDIVGPFEDSYEKKIEDLQLKNIIRYHGFQKDVKPFIKKTNCFILPSYHEGMANTLLESAAMGRPLITSNVPGCLEAVIDCRSGYVVEVKNSEDLYNKIQKFISLSHIEKKKMGIMSRNHIEENFDKKLVVDFTIQQLTKQGLDV